ncbi:hypothetical protein [uncultured Croceitalea sp.]|uniref:hypothetical protein n=1 Tax=uncultured Croceitalea sp. TaxID=1798908 RepID=UPI003305F1B3
MNCFKCGNFFVTLILVYSLLSCNRNQVAEYHRNGNLKLSYFVNSEGNIHGVYKSFYESGNISELKYFDNGILVDSLLTFYDNPNIPVKSKDLYHKQYTKTLHFNKNGDTIKKGRFFKTNRIGKWIFHNDDIDSIVEYKLISGSSYTNQIWIRDNSTNDTLISRGNYFLLRHKDTINVTENLRIKLFLKESFYGEESNMFLVIPKLEKELNKDYSNWDIIEKDTILSLKNDGIPHPELPIDFPVNHFVEFALEDTGSGKKILRGILVEYSRNKEIEGLGYDTVERRLYFDTEYYVKDNKLDSR